MPIKATLLQIYGEKANKRYGLSDVSQLQHALQAAAMAEAEGGSASFIVAALLHDVGHMIHDLGEDAAHAGIDDTHEELAARWLARFFGPEVTEPIRLHVAAKRYLCAADPDYFSKLADDSVRSLALQGGPFSAAEVAAFEATPHFKDAVSLRILDDRAKDPNSQTPDFEHFVQYIDAALNQKSAA